MSLVMALCSPRTPGVEGVVEVLIFVGLYLPLTVFFFVLHNNDLRSVFVIRAGVSLVFAGLMTVFLMAQLDVIHLGLKPVSTSLVVLALIAISLAWPVSKGASARRSLALAAVSLAAFVGLVTAAGGIGGRVGFLVHNRQRFLATAGNWLRPELAPPFEAVMELDGARELVEGKAGAGELAVGDGQSADNGAVNLVLVVVDTWRADSLSAWGGRRELMPLFEQRVARSVVFRDVFASSSWTRSSMAAMITGLTPEAAGVAGGDDVLRGELVTIAEVLKGVGYRTAGLVTNPHLFRGTGFEQGYDEYYQLAQPTSYLPAEGVLDFFSQWALKQTETPRRMFLFVHLMDPHRPYTRPEERDPLFRRHSQELYEENLEEFDGIFDRILNEIGSFFGPQTIVVITSDHGEEFGEHGRWGHGHSLYPELVRVPLLVQGQGVGRGVIDARLEGRDVYRLLAGLASGEASDLGGWGEDHDRAVRTMSTYRRRVGKWWLIRPYHAVRRRGVEDGGWVMIRSAFGGVDELYDLTSDPRAMRNLADRHPEVVGPVVAGEDGRGRELPQAGAEGGFGRGPGAAEGVGVRRVTTDRSPGQGSKVESLKV